MALVPQALKFQGPSLGLWLADFGRELMKKEDWRPDFVFGLLSFFLLGGGGGRVNLREKDSKLRCLTHSLGSNSRKFFNAIMTCPRPACERLKTSNGRETHY